MSRFPIRIDDRQRVAFLITAGVVFLYLLLRAALVPLVHDEANTFFHYVHNGTWVPFIAHWDAGNHVLAMAVGNFTTALFGPSAFSLRTFALLSYLLYAWYVWCMGLSIADGMIRWCTWIALLATPFVLEFFALFRGYGPSIALLMMAVYHLAETWRTDGVRHAIIAPVALSLAVVANLSLLPMWAAGMALLAALAWRSEGQGALRFTGWVIGMVPGVLMAFFAFGLRERGLLYHGNMQGVFNGSVASLVEVVLGTSYLLPRMIVAMLFLVVLHAAYRALRTADKGPRALLLIVTAMLLVSELLARMMLGSLLDVLYPTYRAAMHWIPLFVLSLGYAMDWIARGAAYRRWAALLLLLLPIRTAQVANTRLVTNWSGEYLPVSLFEAAMDAQRSMGRPPIISAPFTLASIWDHHTLVHGDQAFLLDVRDVPDGNADLIMGHAGTLPANGYRTLMEARATGNHLVERERSLPWITWADTVWTAPSGEREFVTVLERDLMGRQGLPMLVAFTAVLSGPPKERGELHLVIELRDASGANLHYHAYPLHRPWSHGRRLPLRVAHSLPSIPPEAARLVSYIWAPSGRVYAVDALMAVFMQLDGPDPMIQ